jgi:hypothetical protein
MPMLTASYYLKNISRCWKIEILSGLDPRLLREVLLVGWGGFT